MCTLAALPDCLHANERFESFWSGGTRISHHIPPVVVWSALAMAWPFAERSIHTSGHESDFQRMMQWPRPSPKSPCSFVVYTLKS